MAGGCSDSEFWDRLVRRCMPCEKTCEKQFHDSCTEFCESLRCRANPGDFYDWLLKRCLPCAELCGSHPIECAQACQEDQPALQFSTTRGRGEHLLTGQHHAVIIYSLLGLCLAALFCTLSVAVLVLLCRSRGRKGHRGHRTGPQEQENSDGSDLPSSKDQLMAAVVVGRGPGPFEEREAWPTETCVHCFPELRAPRHVEDKQPPPALYQQATGMAPPAAASTQRHHDAVAAATDRHASLHGHGGKDGALRIICSPTQSG